MRYGKNTLIALIKMAANNDNSSDIDTPSIRGGDFVSGKGCDEVSIMA
jgi:hypothetical protein